MLLKIDWSKRVGYIWSQHGVQTAWADEAAAEDQAMWFTPDPAS